MKPIDRILLETRRNLPPAEIARLEEALQQDPALRQAAEDSRHTIEHLEEMARCKRERLAPRAQSLAARAREQARRQAAPSRRPVPWRMGAMGAAAAAAALCMMTLLPFPKSAPPVEHPPARPPVRDMRVATPDDSAPMPAELKWAWTPDHQAATANQTRPFLETRPRDIAPRPRSEIVPPLPSIGSSRPAFDFRRAGVQTSDRPASLVPEPNYLRLRDRIRQARQAL